MKRMSCSILVISLLALSFLAIRSDLSAAVPVQSPNGLISLGNGTYVRDILILNLDRRADRWHGITRHLKDLNLTYSRFRGLDAKACNQGDHEITLEPHPDTKIDIKKWCSGGAKGNGDLGKAGCWYTHLQAYFHIVESVKNGAPDDPVLILEDDVWFADDLIEKVAAAGPYLPDDWEVFVLGYKNDYCNYTVGPGNVCKAKLFLDAHAYIVRNASAANNLIHWSNQPSPQVADLLWVSHMGKDINFYMIRKPPAGTKAAVVFQNKLWGSDIQFNQDGTPSRSVPDVKNEIPPEEDEIDPAFYEQYLHPHHTRRLHVS